MKLECTHCRGHFTSQFCFPFKQISLCVECFKTHYCLASTRRTMFD